MIRPENLFNIDVRYFFNRDAPYKPWDILWIPESSTQFSKIERQMGPRGQTMHPFVVKRPERQGIVVGVGLTTEPRTFREAKLELAKSAIEYCRPSTKTSFVVMRLWQISGHKRLLLPNRLHVELMGRLVCEKTRKLIDEI